MLKFGWYLLFFVYFILTLFMTGGTILWFYELLVYGVKYETGAIIGSFLFSIASVGAWTITVSVYNLMRHDLRYRSKDES